MTKKILSAYNYNAFQSLNMAIMALGVPLIIGMSVYGKFAALFAIPGVLQVLTESFYFSYFIDKNYLMVNKITRMVLLLNIIIIILVSYFFFNIIETIYIVVLFFFLVEKSKWQVLFVYTNKNAFYKVSTKIEIFTLVGNILTLITAYITDTKEFIIPIAMVIISSHISKKIFKRECKKISQTDSSYNKNDIKIKIRDFSSIGIRSFEELFITIPPLFIEILLNSTEAGKFRVSISIAKLLFKLFPFRYEIGIAEAVKKKISNELIFKFITYGTFLPIAAILFIYNNSYLYSEVEHKIMPIIIASSGLLAINSIFAPQVVLFYPRMIILALSLFMLTLTVTVFDSFFFEPVYFASCLIYSAFIVNYLTKFEADDKST